MLVSGRNDSRILAHANIFLPGGQTGTKSTPEPGMLLDDGDRFIPGSEARAQHAVVLVALIEQRIQQRGFVAASGHVCHLFGRNQHQEDTRHAYKGHGALNQQPVAPQSYAGHATSDHSSQDPRPRLAEK